MMILTKILIWVKTHVVLASAIAACTAIAVIVPVAWAVHNAGFSPFSAPQHVSAQSARSQKSSDAKDTKSAKKKSEQKEDAASQKDTTPAPPPQPVYTYQDMINLARSIDQQYGDILRAQPYGDGDTTVMSNILESYHKTSTGVEQADLNLYYALQEAFHASNDITADEIKSHIDSLNTTWDAYNKAAWHTAYIFYEDTVKSAVDGTSRTLETMNSLGGYGNAPSCLASLPSQPPYAQNVETMQQRDSTTALVTWKHAYDNKKNTCMSGLTDDQLVALQDRSSYWDNVHID